MRDRAALWRRPAGEHAAQPAPLNLRIRHLRTAAREWIERNDTPAHRTGALGMAAAVVLAGAVAGTAETAPGELRLERQSVVSPLNAGEAQDAAAAAADQPSGTADPAAAPAPAAPAADPVPAGPAPAPDPGPVSPVDDPVVTSPFGYRDNPLAPGMLEFHTGTDFGAVTGTPVKAAASGTVVEAGWHTTGGGGLRIVIDHGDGLQTTYNHLNTIDVEVGREVGAGDVIAGVGSTGNSTGPHLHFEVLRHGAYEDPMAWL